MERIVHVDVNTGGSRPARTGHLTALVRALAASLSTRTAVVVVVAGALCRACIARYRAKAARLRREPAVRRHESHRHATQLCALAIEAHALRELLDIGLAEARVGARKARGRAVVAGFDARGESFVDHQGPHFRGAPKQAPYLGRVPT